MLAASLRISIYDPQKEFNYTDLIKFYHQKGCTVDYTDDDTVQVVDISFSGLHHFSAQPLFGLYSWPEDAEIVATYFHGIPEDATMTAAEYVSRSVVSWSWEDGSLVLLED